MQRYRTGHLRLDARVLYEGARVGGEAAHGHADVRVHLRHLLYAGGLLRKEPSTQHIRFTFGPKSCSLAWSEHLLMWAAWPAAACMAWGYACSCMSVGA